MRKAVLLLGLMLPGLCQAQQSASFKIEEQTFNAGGHPRGGMELSSPGHLISLGALGRGMTILELSSTSYTMSASFAGLNPPPGEVANVRFTGPLSLAWDRERSVGTYNLYLESVTVPFDPGYGTCQASGITTELETIAATPPPGEAIFILVTAQNRLGEEGVKGASSAGILRDNTNACP